MPKIVISGSFNKHFNKIIAIIERFEQLGVEIISPKKSRIINHGDEFLFLASDDVKDPVILQNRHLQAIKQADALYICNHKGYTGASTILEMGYALALGKPVYSKEEINDFTLRLFVKKATSPEEISKLIKDHSGN